MSTYYRGRDAYGEGYRINLEGEAACDAMWVVRDSRGVEMYRSFVKRDALVWANSQGIR